LPYFEVVVRVRKSSLCHLVGLFHRIVLRIPIKLTCYSFSTDRVLRSTLPAIVVLWLHDVFPC